MTQEKLLILLFPKFVAKTAGMTCPPEIDTREQFVRTASDTSTKIPAPATLFLILSGFLSLVFSTKKSK